MAKIKSIFSNKKADTDGQEEFFRDDFPPVVTKNGKKAAEKPAEKKASEPKKAEKKAVKKTASSSNRVAPQPVEKIVNPKTAKAKAAAKKAEKPATKTEPKKTAAKPAAKAEAKKTAAKPTAKAETKKTAANPAAKAETKKTNTKTAVKKADTKAKKPAVEEELYDDSPEVKGAVAVQESNETANGKWDIRRAKDGRFFFCLYASNHVVIAYSQIYSSLTAVTTGINSVISNASKAEIEDTTLKKSVSLPCPKWEIYYDKAEQYRFRLYAPNGLCVCHSSHGYATKGGCKGGIDSIKRFASEDASVNKTYLNK